MSQKNSTNTTTNKREVLEKLLVVWESSHEENLGQFLTNACLHSGPDDLYYADNDALLKQIESYKQRKETSSLGK